MDHITGCYSARWSVFSAAFEGTGWMRPSQAPTILNFSKKQKFTNRTVFFGFKEIKKNFQNIQLDCRHSSIFPIRLSCTSQSSLTFAFFIRAPHPNNLCLRTSCLVFSVCKHHSTIIMQQFLVPIAQTPTQETWNVYPSHLFSSCFTSTLRLLLLLLLLLLLAERKGKKKSIKFVWWMNHFGAHTQLRKRRVIVTLKMSGRILREG